MDSDCGCFGGIALGIGYDQTYCLIPILLSLPQFDTMENAQRDRSFPLMSRGRASGRHRSITHLHYPNASFLSTPPGLGCSRKLPDNNFSIAVLQQHASSLVDYGNNSIFLLYAQSHRECSGILDMAEI